MTKEIVELPDRKSGDINEIRDKKIALAKDATAQSDLPQQLEYLIKNGQTGEFMNVLDSYINEKIRSALGSLIASLDKGAAGTTKAIACIDTNNDLGIINPANLASVLGGFKATVWYKNPSTEIQSTFWDDLVTSYKSVGNYSSFNGESMQGFEGRWMGYRHNNRATILILFGDSVYLGTITNSDGSSKSLWKII